MTSPHTKKSLAALFAATAVIASAAFSSEASARVSFGLSLGAPAYYGYPAYPSYGYAAPAYYAQPAYGYGYAPYYAPPPRYVYAAPAPYYYAPAYPAYGTYVRGRF